MDFRSENVTVDGRRLHLRVGGEGPPLLLVHGLGASAHIWAQLAPRLTGFTTLAVDLPGCGKSDRAVVPEGLFGLAQLVDAAMSRLGHARYGVVGHSLGGSLALELALVHPERVEGLVVANAAFRMPFIAKVGALRGVGDAAFGLSARAPVSRLATKLYLQRIFGDRRRVTEAIVNGYFEASQTEGYFETMLTGLRDLTRWKAEGRLRAIHAPVAVVWGVRDPLFPVKAGKALAQALPRGAFHPLQGCGHCPPEEAPEAMERLVRELFSGAHRVEAGAS